MSGGRARNVGAAPDRRRRMLLVTIGLLVLFGMIPIFGHHVWEGQDRLLAGADYLSGLCLAALDALLRPVHYLFHLLLVAGLAWAIRDRIRGERLLRRTLSALRWTAPDPAGVIAAAARDAGVDPERIAVAPGLPVPAFTAGWLRPRIHLAAELGDRLSPSELTAVIAHEGAHAARRDPLCLAILRFLANVLFWIPLLRDLAEDIAEHAEIRADDAARRGRPLALASAIIAVAEWSPVRQQHPGVGIEHPTMLSLRVRRLTGAEPPARSHVTRASALGAVGALLLVWTTGIAMAHPHPYGHSDHCEHHDSSAWTHLFRMENSIPFPGLSCWQGGS